MRRRGFIALAGVAAVWPVMAHAQQQPNRVRRIGVLIALAEDDPSAKDRMGGLVRGLGLLGWSEGRNIKIDVRFTSGDEGKQRAFAKEIVALQPDVILAHSSQSVTALMRETQTIPIVFTDVSDPIGLGFVASLARPGGNVTGRLTFEASITGKWLAMLKEIQPNLTRALFLAGERMPTYNYFMRAANALAPALGIEIVPGAVKSAQDIERVIETFAHGSNGGLFVPPNNITALHRTLVIALAAKYKLPAVYPGRFFVTEGGLMSYDSERVDDYPKVSIYIDQILRGAKAADLPVQMPTTFRTVVNLSTAKALGLTVPPGLLIAADEVIE